MIALQLGCVYEVKPCLDVGSSCGSVIWSINQDSTSFAGASGRPGGWEKGSLGFLASSQSGSMLRFERDWEGPDCGLPCCNGDWPMVLFSCKAPDRQDAWSRGIVLPGEILLRLDAVFEGGVVSSVESLSELHGDEDFDWKGRESTDAFLGGE